MLSLFVHRVTSPLWDIMEIFAAFILVVWISILKLTFLGFTNEGLLDAVTIF